MNFIEAMEEVSTDLTHEISHLFQRELDGRKLKLRLIKSSLVDIYATFHRDSSPMIVIKSGLFSYPEMSEDLLLGLLCHELGHHLGGNPKKKRVKDGRDSWASAEGQADFFSTAKCLRRYFWDKKNDDFNEKTVHHPEVLHFCEKIKNSFFLDFHQCLKVGSIAREMALFYQRLQRKYLMREEISLFKYKATASPKIILDYPSGQCRLETLFAGIALCQSPWDHWGDTVLDCRIDLSDDNLQEKHSFFSGERPNCWYLDK